MEDPNNSRLPFNVVLEAWASQENRKFSRWNPIPFSRDGAQKYISTLLPGEPQQCRGHICCQIVCSCARMAALAIWGPWGMWEKEATCFWRRRGWKHQCPPREKNCITCNRTKAHKGRTLFTNKCIVNYKNHFTA